MVFFYNGKEYAAASAVEIVSAMALDAGCESPHGGTLRSYLTRALGGLADRVHMRELDAGVHLPDEALAFNYLCLLDEHDLGRLDTSAPGGER
jgi:hypothetical protein